MDLKNYYDGVISLAPPRLSCLFPNPTPVDPSNTLLKLAYRQFLSGTGQPTSALVDLKNPTTTTFIATLDDTNQDTMKRRITFLPEFSLDRDSILRKAHELWQLDWLMDLYVYRPFFETVEILGWLLLFQKIV